VSGKIKRRPDEGCGWPSTVTCVEVTEQIVQQIQDNRRPDGTASEMSIIHGGKRRKNGLWHNRKCFILMESQKL
jgi:hypothetical protein